jgi:hypothetical protein
MNTQITINGIDLEEHKIYELEGSYDNFIGLGKRKDYIANESESIQGIDMVWVNTNLGAREFSIELYVKYDENEDNYEYLIDLLKGQSNNPTHNNNGVITMIMSRCGISTAQEVIFLSSEITTLLQNNRKVKINLLEINPASREVESDMFNDTFDDSFDDTFS